MFLKSYFDLSDEKLIKRFNIDWGIQLFCGKLLGGNQMIRDLGIHGGACRLAENPGGYS